LLLEHHRQLLAAVRLARFNGVGAKRFVDLVREHGSPQDALTALGAQSELFPAGDKAPMLEEQQRVEAYLRRGGCGTFWGAYDYPRLLAAIGEPPPFLFYRGPLWPPEAFAVAIVGPRQAGERATKFAGELARKLSAFGVTIVSGGAEGVDAAAHWGALNAGGRTVLVAATGLDKCYPDKNRDLFDRAARQGCVVTELLPGTPPRRDFFPTRNRIVVGLAQALVVIGGHLKSGTASSWQHMRKLGRPIFTWTGADPDRFELPAAIVAAGGLPLTEPNAELVLSRILQQRP